MRFRTHPAMLRKEARIMAIVPDKYLDLLQQKKAFANIATLNPDGTPQVTPVWFDYTDGLVRVKAAASSGVVPRGVTPILAKADLSSGRSSALLISRLSFASTSGGSPAGA